MKLKSFGHKLFLLFLMFAIIPAVIITLFGYFLLVESGEQAEYRENLYPGELTRYYNDLLFDNIEAGIEQYLATARIISPLLDFIFIQSDSGLQAIKRPELLSPELTADIIKTAGVRPRGFVEKENQYYQFSMKELETGEKLYAGLVHDLTYSDLVTTLRTSYASETAGRSLRQRYIIFLAMLFITVSLLMVAVAYLFSNRLAKNIARPLSELSEASKEIAGGNFDQKIEPAGDREIQTLVENFNRMAAQLEQITARLAQTQRVAAWRQVARRFAHELKNPLQPLLISLYQIEKQLLDTEAYDKIYEPLKAASEELKHLTNLAERFSHLAKLPPPQMERADLIKIIRSVARLYEARLVKFDFVIDLPEREVIARVDTAYLREALHNLLQNAIDASTEGERIVVKLDALDERINISITDYGEGMSPQTVTSARLPYYTTKDRGTGLGLAIVEKSVNELGGQLFIESQSGFGTTVTITLPYDKG
ncbi:MAG: HAMP domain-containing protein [candidate division Zixibacteria bacterium]|nr:HAMP domain-containing protein [candidate division Zixibacteria bacterium]